MFNHEMGNVYQRAERMIKDTVIGGSMGALRQAWFGEHGHRLVAVRYDSLVADPQAVVSRLYGVLEEPMFIHNFDRVEYDSPELDSFLGVPGLHRVSGPVRNEKRPTVLPSDLFNQYDQAFWDDPAENPRGVLIL
jgi:sulfotransferase